jgi:hypothetical protein
LALVKEVTDESVRSEREAARILGRPVLAAIPRILDTKQLRLSWVRAAGIVAGTAVCSVVVGLLLARFGARFL